MGSVYKQTKHPQELDAEGLRAKYSKERDRRIRPEGLGQYQSAAGEFGYCYTSS